MFTLASPQAEARLSPRRASGKLDWTKPLRGSPECPRVRRTSGLSPILPSDLHRGIRSGANAWNEPGLRSGVFYDPASPTHARGHAGAESFSAHTACLRRTRRPLRPALRSFTGRVGAGPDPDLSSLFDEREAAGAQLDRHHRGGASFSLQGDPQEGLVLRRGRAEPEEAADVARRAEH